MPRTVRIALLLAIAVTGGCYHATVNTGIEPAAPRVSMWKHSFIYGLVPMSPVDAKKVCGDRGVARVETSQPFVQGLVTLLTSGIYTPWEVAVTCGRPPLK